MFLSIACLVIIHRLRKLSDQLGISMDARALSCNSALKLGSGNAFHA